MVFYTKPDSVLFNSNDLIFMKKDNIIKKTSKTITDGADQVLEQLKNGLSKIGDLGTNTKNKFIDYVKDVFNVLPLLEKAGFRTNRLIVGVSIPSFSRNSF